MTFYVENETDVVFPFDAEKLVEEVANAVLDAEECPYESEINVLITDNEGIRVFNREYRDIDRETDVITFALEDEDTLVMPSDERILGDIYISIDKAKSQAIEYGHSFKREICFLAVHGFLHLLGYDHMNKEDEEEMFSLQELILNEANIKK